MQKLVWKIADRRITV